MVVEWLWRCTTESGEEMLISTMVLGLLGCSDAEVLSIKDESCPSASATVGIGDDGSDVPTGPHTLTLTGEPGMVVDVDDAVSSQTITLDDSGEGEAIVEVIDGENTITTAVSYGDEAYQCTSPSSLTLTGHEGLVLSASLGAESVEGVNGRPLTPRQVAYAALDAEVLLGLYEVI